MEKRGMGGEAEGILFVMAYIGKREREWDDDGSSRNGQRGKNTIEVYTLC
jgi:hypothetical protein